MAVTPSILALDVGERRIGVALANLDNRLARPLLTIYNDNEVVNQLQSIIKEQSINTLVIGLPRNLNGEDTKQTKFVRDFATQLRDVINIEIVFEDEALSSVRAKEALDHKSKSYSKEDVDAMAAAYILDDYLSNYKKDLDG